MKKKFLYIVCGFIALLAFSDCSVKDAVDDSIKQADCLSLIAKVNNTNSEDRTCAEISADIDRITRDCNQFLEDDTKARLAEIKADCTDN